MEPSAILADVTALSAILDVSTAPVPIFAAVTAPSATAEAVPVKSPVTSPVTVAVSTPVTVAPALVVSNFSTPL